MPRTPPARAEPAVAGAGRGDVGAGVGLRTRRARERRARRRDGGGAGSESAMEAGDSDAAAPAPAADGMAGDVGAVMSLAEASPTTAIPRILVVDGLVPTLLLPGNECVLRDVKFADRPRLAGSAVLLKYAAENGLIKSQSRACSARQWSCGVPCPPVSARHVETAPLSSMYASHSTGFLLRSTRAGRLGGDGGTHVPLRMASSTMRRCRRRRMNERTTMAADTLSNRTKVAKKVYTVTGDERQTAQRGEGRTIERGRGCNRVAAVLRWRRWSGGGRRSHRCHCRS